MTKIEALAKFLGCDVSDLIEAENNESCFVHGRQEYEVLTDSVWAFNSSFLAAHCDLDEDDIKTIQDNNKFEDNNKLLTKLINDLDHFVNDAILSDGRGHFLSSYDGEENEEDDFYIYRTN